MPKRAFRLLVLGCAQLLGCTAEQQPSAAAAGSARPWQPALAQGGAVLVERSVVDPRVQASASAAPDSPDALGMRGAIAGAGATAASVPAPVTSSAGAAAPTGGPAAREGTATGERSGASAAPATQRPALRAAISLTEVPPGSEDHVCVVLSLDNSETEYVNDIRVSLSEGSHHLVVDRRPADQPLQLEPAPCDPSAGDDTRIMIAQQPETRFSLPEHTGFRFDAHQRVYILMHYINLHQRPADIAGEVTLGLAPREPTPPLEMRHLFLGTLDIDLPPHRRTTVTSLQAVGDPAAGERHIVAMTTHTHRLSERVFVERVWSELDPPSQPIYESWDWAEPPLLQIDPVLVLMRGERLRLSCQYFNTTDKTVRFGSGFYDEMCFMWLYYYDG